MILSPRKSLNKAYLKQKPARSEIEKFKVNFKSLLTKINEIESEENQKNYIRDFFRDTYLGDDYEINTKDRKDLVIHIGKDSNFSVGVIIEAKRPGNKAEMLSKENINTKAFQELVLYFMRERIIDKNLEIKHLIATNIYEWFIFDAQVFEKYFAGNKEFVKQFEDFESKCLSGTKTEFFYKDICLPFINSLSEVIPFTYFDLRDYQTTLENDSEKDDTKLITLYKLLSPEHLLKLPFQNDSNSLDKTFYSELLYIIGLEEVKNGSKKLIKRCEKQKRNSATFIENTILELDSLDKIYKLENPSQYGKNQEEKLFSVSIELVLTWINRILFLKLLEGQQIKYHKGDRSFAYMNIEKIEGLDDLNTLFFQVLSRKLDDRNDQVKEKFKLVPYLNSSLFEVSYLEDKCFTISQLKDRKIPIYSGTVLKESTGKRKTGELGILDYLFEFLNAYDFSSEGSEEIQEESKTIINASVLGLIFEKINGYKDGSFFTPGFITTYMCKETIRQAILQKFNEIKNWECKTIEELYNKLDRIEIKEANDIINSIKICDPAVGSGHFLVSALNEIIAIKSELGVLVDKKGKKLRDYQITIENDELIISDTEDDHLFEYNPKDKESQRVQETIFQEKQKIIENCLFGVDINPNSVNICRLRLWIELLKNTYYKPDSGYLELETLPNIDINIKKGNSLISKYPLDMDIKEVLKKKKWKIEDYKKAVRSYQNAQDKSEKREMETLIHSMKSEFIVEMDEQHPDQKKLRKLRGELSQGSMFELTKKEIAERKKLEKTMNALEGKIKEVEDNKIYENSFEWRIEFPEVLNKEGEFIGFDVIIGNPPYGVKFNNVEKKYYKDKFNNIHIRTPESYNYFWGLTFNISKKNGFCNFITPSSFLSQIEFEKTRKIILENYSLYSIVNLGDAIFEDVATPTCIIGISKNKVNSKSKYADISAKKRSIVPKLLLDINSFVDTSSFITNNSSSFIVKQYKSILDKCYQNPTLKDIAEDVATGVSPGLGDAFIVTEKQVNTLNLEKELIKNLIIGGEITKYNLHSTQKKRIIYCTATTNLFNYPNILE